MEEMEENRRNVKKILKNLEIFLKCMLYITCIQFSFFFWPIRIQIVLFELGGKNYNFIVKK